MWKDLSRRGKAGVLIFLAIDASFIFLLLSPYVPNLVGEYQDAFPPSDISNLNLFVHFDPNFDGGGYFRIQWDKASDPVSGVDKYNVYRKIGDNGIFEKIASITDTDAMNYQFLDPFASIGKRVKTFYRIAPVDHVGNERDFTISDWEVFEWPPLPPIIDFEEKEQKAQKGKNLLIVLAT